MDNQLGGIGKIIMKVMVEIMGFLMCISSTLSTIIVIELSL